MLFPSCRKQTHQNGGVLLAALIITLLSTTLILTAAHNSGTRMESSHLLQEGQFALMYARMGLEFAACYLSAHDDWRINDLNGGLIVNDVPFENSYLTIVAVDPDDGIIERDTHGSSTIDPVEITSKCTVGPVTRTVKALYRPVPHEALRYAIYSNKKTVLEDIFIQGRIRSLTGNLDDNGGVNITGNLTVEPGRKYPDSWIDGDTAIFFIEPEASLPVVDFDWYVTRGMTISHTSFKMSSKITSSDNPFGTESSEGIYVIDCGNNDIIWIDAYIEACLVFVNVRTVYLGNASNQSDYYHVSPDPASLPAMIVDGRLEMYISGDYVSGSITGMGDVKSYLGGVFFATDCIKGPQLCGGTPFEVKGSFISKEVRCIAEPGTRFQHDMDLNQALIHEFTGNALRPVANSLEEL